MSADTLRAAAAKMRERAEAAIHDSEGVRVWHSVTPESVSAGPWEIAAGLARPDAEHIASWHPAVALAVADWLEVTAADFDNGYAVGDDPSLDAALAVANAYLGT